MQPERLTREPLNFCHSLVLKEQAKQVKNIREDALAIVHNLFGVDLWPKQREIIGTFYEGSYRELVQCMGMRSSKSFMSALIGAIETARWLLLPDPWAAYNIIPGTDVYGVFTAPSLRQVKKYTFMFFKNILKRSWWFQTLDPEYLGESVRFPGRGLEVMAIPSSSAGQAGGTFLFAIMDEVARFVDTEGHRGGDMVYDTLNRGTKTLNGKLMTLSSPLFNGDKIMRLIEEAKTTPSMLAYHLATWEINPNLPREKFDEDFRRDPEKAKRDFGAIPSYAIEPYYMEPERIQMDPDRRNPYIITEDSTIEGLKRQEGVKYYLHGDPAIRNDAFGLAVAHLDPNGKAIVDLVHRFLPPQGREINARHVRQVILNVHRILKLSAVTFDMWNYPIIIQDLKDMRIPVDILIIKKEQHDHLKERIYGKTISIPMHKFETRDPRMPENAIQELRELELVKGQKVDHPSTGSKDVADAIAGAVWNANTNTSTRRNRYFRAG